MQVLISQKNKLLEALLDRSGTLLCDVCKHNLCCVKHALIRFKYAIQQYQEPLKHFTKPNVVDTKKRPSLPPLSLHGLHNAKLHSNYCASLVITAMHAALSQGPISSLLQPGRAAKRHATG